MDGSASSEQLVDKCSCLFVVYCPLTISMLIKHKGTIKAIAIT